MIPTQPVVISLTHRGTGRGGGSRTGGGALSSGPGGDNSLPPPLSPTTPPLPPPPHPRLHQVYVHGRPPSRCSLLGHLHSRGST